MPDEQARDAALVVHAYEPDAARRELDERLMVAARVAAQHRMSAFSALLEEHRRHESFELRDWPFFREMGFACRCTGEEQEFRISIRTLREILPEAREAFMAFRERRMRFGTKKRRLDHLRAEKKSRALLHRFLTKKQRVELRGLHSFDVRGADGLRYRLTERSGVYLLDGEKPVAGFCVVRKGHEFLPVYDLMLAHKLLLETNPAKFWSVANIRDLDPPPNCEQRNYNGGAWEVIPIPQVDLDNPGPWVAARLAEV